MALYTLVIGSKNYSSWSMRAWLALRHAGADFDEVVIPLDTPDAKERILAHSPAGLVPILKDGNLRVWESMAILEVVAERSPEKPFWPADESARAHARSVSQEMHAGFRALRQALPMNCRRRYESFEITREAEADIARVQAIWSECRERHAADGDFLFGPFGNADAMFAPVASRFMTYGVTLDAVSRAYVDALVSQPAVHEWCEAAAEERVIEKYEF